MQNMKDCDDSSPCRGLFESQIVHIKAGDIVYMTDSWELALQMVTAGRRAIVTDDNFSYGEISEAAMGSDLMSCKWVWCYYTDDKKLKELALSQAEIREMFPEVHHVFRGNYFYKKEYLQESEHEKELRELLEKIEAEVNPPEVPTDRYHDYDANGKPTEVYDTRIRDDLIEREGIIIMGGTPYIYKEGHYKADLSGAQIKRMIEKCLHEKYKKATHVKRIYEAFKQVPEIEYEFKDLNDYPPYWINFKNGFYDAKEGRFIEHGKAYRAINQIPHEYSADAEDKGGTFEKWLQFIVPDPEDREMLLQFAGYTLTRDVSQQKFLILNGTGGTGKSVVIRLFEAMVGESNASNIALHELSHKFASYGLMGKLLNSCADLQVSIVEDSSVLKKILGEDTIRAEQKGKDAISFKSYAKILFSTNELPIFKDERSNGVYRRIMALTMNNKPAAADPDLYDRLKENLPYFIRLSVEALKRMYQSGHIAESSNSKKAVEAVRMDSDSVQAFICEMCEVAADAREERTAFYGEYEKYCHENGRIALTNRKFFNSLRVKGFRADLKSNGRFFALGVKIKSDFFPADNIKVPYDREYQGSNREVLKVV